MIAAPKPQHIPDILDCLAQLSNDEVPTPPKLARAMLDLLPDEVWSEPDYRWLDPFSKSGIFLREAAGRLLEGLAGWEPDFDKRREHIYREMLWGTSITEMTGQISRRTLYYSRDASGEHSVIPLETAAGNLPFVPAEHSFDSKGRCTICGAPEDLERGGSRENYAYSFIHDAYPTKEMEGMKFDVIVGNPPYQIDSDGNFRTMPVYQKFVEQAIAMNPRYIVMITPSRWFTGGLGLGDYRASMLGDKRLRALVDYANAAEAFPGVDIKGGVSYFLWDRLHDGRCDYTLVREGQAFGPTGRELGEFDVLVRDPRSVSILRKVREAKEPSLDPAVHTNNEFGLMTNLRSFSGRPTRNRSLPVYLVRNGKRVRGYIGVDELPRGGEWIDCWKVVIPKSGSDGGVRLPDVVLGKPFVAEPPAVLTQTYIFLEAASKAEAQSIEAYVRTRLFRFLVSLRKISQHAPKPTYTWVPMLPWDHSWTDAELYERYGLTNEEIAFIESQVKEMPAPETSAA